MAAGIMRPVRGWQILLLDEVFGDELAIYDAGLPSGT